MRPSSPNSASASSTVRRRHSGSRLVRLRRAEGSIALGLGRTELAEAAFREVQQEFLHQEMAFNAALVSLDLAALYAREGRTGDLKGWREGAGAE